MSTITSPAPARAAAPWQEGAAAAPLAVLGADLTTALTDGRVVRAVNLDVAASAPAARAAADAVTAVLPYSGSVHRGTGLTARVSTASFEAARATCARFLGARDDDTLVFTRNTTDALTLLASAVPDGGEVVHLDVEHHANLLPWRTRAGSPPRHGSDGPSRARTDGAPRCVLAAPTLAATLAALEAELAGRPAALLTVTGASNVTGEVLPLAELAELAHRHGARLAVDAAQLAPHRRIDVAALGTDYLALSGHKLYAPFGGGLLLGRADWLDAAPPHQPGGGATLRVRHGEVRWATGHARHQGGTPNLPGAGGLAAAGTALAALPDGALATHDDALRERLVAGLADLPGVEVLRLWPDGEPPIGVVAFTVAGHDPATLATRLADEHGVGVRAGRFCAHPLLDRLGLPGGALRASFGAGSTHDDVDRLLAALAALIETD